MINGRTKRMGKNICRLGHALLLLGSFRPRSVPVWPFTNLEKCAPAETGRCRGIVCGAWQYLDMPHSSGNNFNYFCFMDQQTDSHRHTCSSHSHIHTHTLLHTLAIWNKMAKISARHSIHKQMINLKRTTKIWTTAATTRRKENKVAKKHTIIIIIRERGRERDPKRAAPIRWQQMPPSLSLASSLSLRVCVCASVSMCWKIK